MKIVTGLLAGVVSCVLSFFVGVASTQYCPYVKKTLEVGKCSCACPCVNKTTCGCDK